MTTETKTIRHRNGTATTWNRVHLPLEEVARRFAIWTRLLPVGTRDAAGIEYGLEREARGYLNPDGTPAVVTRLRVRTAAGEGVATKTRLGEYFDASIETLDESGATFWERDDKPNRWILADVFAV